MGHVKAFALKFAASLVLLYVILGVFNGMSFGEVLLIAFVLTAVSYPMGDVMLLPKTNNTTATAVDFGLAMVLIWFMSENMMFREGMFAESLLASIGIAAFEYFFHLYMVHYVVAVEPGNHS